jgi:hypothetical protein
LILKVFARGCSTVAKAPSQGAQLQKFFISNETHIKFWLEAVSQLSDKVSQANELEAIEKLVQRYQHTRDMTVPAHHQATKIAQPGNGPFNFPTTLVTA